MCEPIQNTIQVLRNQVRQPLVILAVRLVSVQKQPYHTRWL
jgi:hypothetical protein